MGCIEPEKMRPPLDVDVDPIARVVLLATMTRFLGF